MAERNEAMAALSSLMDDPAALDTPTVQCGVCDALLDARDGTPVAPVDESNVASARQYILESGQAEKGGVALI